MQLILKGIFLQHVLETAILLEKRSPVLHYILTLDSNAIFIPNSINLTPQKWCPTKMLVNSAACRLSEQGKDSSGLDLRCILQRGN